MGTSEDVSTDPRRGSRDAPCARPAAPRPAPRRRRRLAAARSGCQEVERGAGNEKKPPFTRQAGRGQHRVGAGQGGRGRGAAKRVGSGAHRGAKEAAASQ